MDRKRYVKMLNKVARLNNAPVRSWRTNLDRVETIRIVDKVILVGK